MRALQCKVLFFCYEFEVYQQFQKIFDEETVTKVKVNLLSTMIVAIVCKAIDFSTQKGHLF
jgi:hypothetical protein